MCLTIPGKILSIREGIATVRSSRGTAQVDLGFVVDAKVGDWLLYATKRAVRVIDEKDAKEIISLLEDNYRTVNVDKLPKKFVNILSRITSYESRIMNVIPTEAEESCY